MRVLVIEDYAPIRQAVGQGLAEAGFAVDMARDGEEGLWYATSFNYDVVVLDLMLPKVDGLSLLRQLRAAERTARVLILTAKDALDDRIAGLNQGGDDYLVKPFDLGELLARVRALVRRKYDAKETVVRVADFELDTVRRRVRRRHGEIELTAKEYALLEYLALRKDQVVTRTDIWEHVYDFHSSASSNVVDVYIGYLRRKLEPPGSQRLIQTRRGQGYVFGEQAP